MARRQKQLYSTSDLFAPLSLLSPFLSTSVVCQRALQSSTPKELSFMGLPGCFLLGDNYKVFLNWHLKENWLEGNPC